MILPKFTSADQPFVNGKLNPNFFGATKSSSDSVTETVVIQPPPYEKTIVITPPPYTSDVYVQPPAVVEKIDGVDVTVSVPPIKQTITVTPPPITQEITVHPPSYTTTVTKPGSTKLTSKFAVGVVQTWPYRLCALIKPNVVVGAKHYSIPVGSKIRFYNETGYEEASVKKVAVSFYDLEAYYLDRDIRTVEPSPVFSTDNYSSLSRKEIVTFGLVGDRNPPYNSWVPAAAPALYARTLNVSAQDMTGVCAFQTPGSFLQPGDSGAPSFILEDGIYKFLGSNWKISTTYNINLASPRVAILNSL